MTYTNYYCFTHTSLTVNCYVKMQFGNDISLSHTVPPSPPTNVQVSQVSTQTARVTWRAPTVSFSNSLTRVSFYRIVARQSSFDIPDVVVYVPSTQTSYSFPSTLEEFTAYTCEVFANNSFGYGRSGHAVRFKTLETSQFL